MTGIRLPLALSLAAHAVVLMLLVLLPAAPPPAEPPPPAGIEVAFAPSLPQPPPPAQPVKVEPLPPPPKPPVPPPRREIVRRIERPVEHREMPRPHFPAAPEPRVEPAFRAAPVPPAAMPPQQAALPPARVPAPAPSARISPDYETLLGEWLNSHKYYPESARERGEEGRAILHFAVNRSGRVTGFAVVKSTGYPDLDAGLEEMMRGASLPPFPADMPQSSISVSVTIRFSLER